MTPSAPLSDATRSSISSPRAAGLASDKFGFSKVSISIAICSLICLQPLWLLLVNSSHSIALSLLAIVLLAILSASSVPILAMALCLFPVHLRTTFFGICYNGAQLVFGATAPFIENAVADALTPHPAFNHTGAPSPASVSASLAAPAIWIIIANTVTLVGLVYYMLAVHHGVVLPSTIGEF